MGLIEKDVRVWSQLSHAEPPQWVHQTEAYYNDIPPSHTARKIHESEGADEEGNDLCNLPPFPLWLVQVM